MDQWRYFDFTGSPCGSWPYAQDLIQQNEGTTDAPYHSLTEDQDEDGQTKTAKRADEEFRACAKALTSKRVMELSELLSPGGGFRGRCVRPA